MALTGTFTATGVSAAFKPPPNSIQMNMSLWGAFVATLVLERSFDKGVTWLPLTALGTSFSFTGPCTETFEEYEAGAQWRWRCTAFTSGTVNYRISQ